MAKITNVRQDQTLPYFGERMIVQTYRGRLYVRSWPRKRGKNLHPKVILQNQRFHNANVLAKYAPDQQQRMAIEMAKKGPLYPRDYITAAMMRGLYVFTLPNGRKIYPMSNVFEISEELDAFGQNPGTMLARGADRWYGIEPSALYQVPIINSLTDQPVMRTQGPELGGHHFTSMNPNAIEGGNEAAKGRWGQLQVDTRLQQLTPTFTAINGAQYKVEVWTYDGTKLLAKLGESTVATWTFAGLARRRFQLTSDIMLTGGTIYAFIFIRTDATGTTSNQLWDHSGWGSGGWPINDFSGLITFNTTTLTVNQAHTRKTFGGPGCIDGIMVL